MGLVYTVNKGMKDINTDGVNTVYGLPLSRYADIALDDGMNELSCGLGKVD